jgi:hypothetical protein
VATETQVEAKLQELIDRLEGDGGAQGSFASSLPEPRVVALEVTDLGSSYWAELAAGKMSELQSGAPDRWDIRVRAGSDDLVALVDGHRSLFSAVMSGQVKVDASISDLMRLRKLA